MRRIVCVLFLAVVMIVSMNSECLAYRAIEGGCFYEQKAEGVTVIESKENLDAALSNLGIQMTESIDGVDFSKELIILIVASASPNPGYSIVIETIDFKDGQANVEYRTQRGPDGVMYAQVISYPWLLVAVER